MTNENNISLKELFERVIQIETKLDLVKTNQLLGRRHSTKLAALIIILILLDIAIYWFLFKHN